jgi:amino acid adenylation domain-containing protein
VNSPKPTRINNLNIVDRLRRKVDAHSTQTILRFLGDQDEEVALTYEQLDRQARSIGARLQALHASGERILLLHQPGIEYVTALLGCLYAGAIAVPAYPPRFNRSMERLNDVVADAQARFAVTSQKLHERIQRHLETEPQLQSLQWLITDDADSIGASNDWRPTRTDGSTIALLQYTSGSTSAPKGVMLTHANLLYNIDALASANQATSSDSLVSWLPPYHDMGLIGATLSPLLHNVTTTLLTPSAFLQRPLRWLAAISRYHATISGGPNFAYEQCVRRINETQRATLDLSTWRVAFSGAERVRAETIERFSAAFADCGFKRRAFVPCYGLAEATLGVSYTPIDSQPNVIRVDEQALGKKHVQQSTDATARAVVSCGIPLQSCDVQVVDPETCERLVSDEVGELWVNSPGVALGYWNKPDVNREIFQAHIKDNPTQDYLRTGDLGFVRNDEVFIIGRIKDLIVLRGVNYYPEDIESTVENAHAKLRLAASAAFAIDNGGEEQLVVVQEVEPGRDLPLQQMAEAIRQAIAEAHELRVHDVVLVQAGGVPRTSSGKVQRRRCRELYLNGELTPLLQATTATTETAPAPAEIVEQLRLMMSELLGIETVAADDDFFWLGGHSLLVTQLASRIRESFKVELPLRVMFEAPTPRNLATKIANAPHTANTPDIKPVDRNAALPLSFSQERMWFLHQLNPMGTAYNVAGAVSLDGPLNTDALHAAFDEIMKRHEALRTRFLELDGAPQIQIVESATLSIPFHDLSTRPDADKQALSLATTLACKPFDIANDLLIRVELYRTGPDHHILCACLHHLITDAWSMGLMIADLKNLYELQVAGKPMPTSEPAITYVDYANWQRSYLSDEQLQGELDHWRKKLAGAEALELPTDKPRSVHRSSAGHLEPLSLPDELMASLESFSVTQGTTLFMVMLTAFEVLLHRYTNSFDLVVGVPVANRNWLASEKLMGTLVNTLPVRLQFNGDPTFTELLQQVRNVALDAYSHQNLPFERLVSALGLERRMGESPLVRVMFDFQNTPMPGKVIAGVQMTPLMLSRGSAQFDLSLLILDTELGRIAGVEYSTELYDAGTIKRLLGHYRSILESIVVQPYEAISRIPMLPADEREALLRQAQANVQNRYLPKPVYANFVEHAGTSPNAIAVTDDASSYTYGELLQRTHQITAAMHSDGVRPGSRVAVYLERDRDLVAALLAALCVGAAYVPLDPRHPQDRVDYVLENCAPQAVITTTQLSKQLPASLQQRIVRIDNLSTTEVAKPPVYQGDETHAAYIIYTSGSTGRPKGVEVSRHALANFVQSIRHTPGMQSDDRLLSVTTISFDIAGLELFVPLCSGASVYVASSEAAADGMLLLELLQRWQPTVLQATPATWKMLIESGWQGSPTLKILCGGEALPAELAQVLLPRCQSLWNMYGPTETTIWSTLHRIRTEELPLISIGKPIDATCIYILDPQQQLVPVGVAGEIYIGGDGVANGYFQRPDLTAEKFLPDPFRSTPARMYRTGDAGRLNSQGLLEHLGRLDSQIKIRGFRIEPGEIEIVLKENTAIRDAVVIAREDRPGDVRLVAYYVPTATSDIATGLPLTALTEPLRRKLPAYMIPSTFIVLDALPLTPNGKIDRKALPKPEVTLEALSEDYLAPRDNIETALTELWQELLNVKKIGVRDNFFMLGGHSLLAVRCFARIKQRFGATLPMSTLFERPTIEYLAECIHRVSSHAQTPSLRLELLSDQKQRFEFLVPIQESGTRPPIFCVHGAGGNVMNFWSITRHLGSNQPFFGLQARGVDGDTEPHHDIPDMAADYLHELRRLQPKGPYYLSGYCAGGWIAFEMARQLLDAGEQVAMLTLLDCYHPRIEAPVPTIPERLHNLRAEGLGYIWRKTKERMLRDWTNLSCSLRIQYHQWRKHIIPYELRDFWLTQTLLQATRRYQPGNFQGTLWLLRAKDIEPQLDPLSAHLGWLGHAINIRVIDVPGNHHTLAEEPNVVAVAAALRQCQQAATCTSGNPDSTMHRD